MSVIGDSGSRRSPFHSLYRIARRFQSARLYPRNRKWQLRSRSSTLTGISRRDPSGVLTVAGSLPGPVVRAWGGRRDLPTRRSGLLLVEQREQALGAVRRAGV